MKDKTLSRFPPGLAVLVDGSPTLQWFGIGVFSVLLGGLSVFASSLPVNHVILFVVAILSLFLVLVVQEMRKLLLGVILLDIPFQLDFYFAHREEIAQLGTLGGINISVTTIALLGLYALWFIEGLAQNNDRARFSLRDSQPFLWYLFFTACSVLVARDATLSFFEIFLLLQMLLLQVYIACTVRTRQEVVFIVSLLIVGIILESLVIIQVWYTGEVFAIAGISTRMNIDANIATQVLRPYGTLGSPNYAAAYLGLVLSLIASVFFTQLSRGYKTVAALAVGLGGVALLATFSRGGWIALSIALMVMGAIAWKRRWLSLSTPLAVIFSGLLLAVVFQDRIIARVTADDGGSAHSRIPLMKLAFNIIQDQPLLGVGANNFATVMNNYVTADLIGEWLYTVHNSYLRIWAEIGIGGLLAYVWILFATLRYGWRGGKSSDPILAPLAIGLMAGIAGHMVQLFVDVFNSRPPIQLLWFSAGFLAAICTISEEQEQLAVSYHEDI